MDGPGETAAVPLALLATGSGAGGGSPPLAGPWSPSVRGRHVGCPPGVPLQALGAQWHRGWPSAGPDPWPRFSGVSPPPGSRHREHRKPLPHSPAEWGPSSAFSAPRSSVAAWGSGQVGGRGAVRLAHAHAPCLCDLPAAEPAPAAPCAQKQGVQCPSSRATGHHGQGHSTHDLLAAVVTHDGSHGAAPTARASRSTLTTERGQQPPTAAHSREGRPRVLSCSGHPVTSALAAAP